MKKIVFVFVVSVFLLQYTAYSQLPGTAWQQLLKLSRPEKCWVITHPFVAKKAWHYTRLARIVTDSVQKYPVLDGDANGGQVDAFRHAYWMALLTQNLNWRKAFSLGKAHEKGNYLDYKKHRTEDGTLPDKVAGDMDLWNNNTGINIGKEYNHISSDSLKTIVIDYILQGKMKIIRKNQNGQFLDAHFQIITSDSLKGKWENTKVLDSSDKKKSK